MLCFVAGNTDVLAQVPDCTAEFYPGRVIVRFQPGTTAAARGNAHAAAGALRVLEEIDTFQGLQLVEVTPGQEKNVVAAYRNQAGVKYAEPDYLLHLAAESTTQLWGLHNDGQTIQCGTKCSGYPPVTSDPGTANADIDAIEAWGIWKGDEEILIGVVDTGIDYTHDDLKDNMWTNPGECPGGPGTCQPGDLNADNCPGACGVDEDGDLKKDEDSKGRQPGESGYNNDLVADDDENGCNDDFHGCNFWPPTPNGDVSDTDAYGGHGTHVAGTIAARGGNGTGVVGVNWKARLVSLPIFFYQPCSTQLQVIKAMQYCIHNNIKVSNHSYGGTSQCEGFCDVFGEVRDQIVGGHIAIAAAHNYPQQEERNNDLVSIYPASCPQENIIAVAAVDNDFMVPQFSHYGRYSVDVGAPGANVYSTLRYNRYDFLSGTSMATPHVTGVVALVWSRFDLWDWSRVKNRVLNTVRPVRALRAYPKNG